jgi:hypothetical protein
MNLHLINDHVPDVTIERLRLAAQARALPVVEHHAPAFEYLPDQRALPGDLLYRPATSTAASHVEQFLLQPGVASFYTHPDGAIQYISEPLQAFVQAQLSVPRHFHCHSSDRALLRQWVDRLGGLPIVVKFNGFSGGMGVLRVDSLPSLYSMVDFALSTGRSPLLMSYVDHAEHWRVVVVGTQAIAAYLNPQDADDFRSHGSDKPEDCTAQVDPDMAALAVGAVQALGLEFGGVDILRHPSGRLYLLEANFPCFHTHAETVGGLDVSGAMLDHLIRKSHQKDQKGLLASSAG